MVGGRKVATTVYLTPEQDSLLKVVHHQTHLPVAELVRQGVDLILSQYAVPQDNPPVVSAAAPGASARGRRA